MSINDELEARNKKLDKLKKLGIMVYPEKFDTNTNSEKLLSEVQDLPGLPEVNAKLKETHKIAGRIMTWREHGKIVFANLQDNFGKIQISFTQEILGEEYNILELLDRGDWIGVQGDMFLTQKGEPTLLIKSWVFLGKALRPLPEKWHGIKDQEIKYRQRYLDLIMNEETRERFNFRSEFIKSLREFYWQNGFQEVETPTLMHSATGANAKPYKTHNNALDIDVFLRISVELPLKELIVGGMHKVFELGRAFRNEGQDPSHLPEHTHLEHYSAFWNWEDNVVFTEKMIDYLFDTLDLERKREVMDRDGKMQKVNFKTPFKRINYIDLLKKDTGLDILKYDNADSLRDDLKKKKNHFEDMDKMGLTTLVDNMYKKVSRPKIIDPTILYNYPDYMQPLARRNDENENIVDQFQLVVNGWEIIKAYSELVDPKDQKQRFVDQLKAKAEGDEEAQEGDDDYIEAMEYGMPPISGWGMGIDRLIALLTHQPNLRDVVLFPLMKPENDNQVNENIDLTKKDIGITRKEAWDLLQTHLKNGNLQKHCLAVEFVMKAFAKEFKEDLDVWGITGLLHDLDYEYTKEDIERHSIETAKILNEAGVNPIIIQAIKAHNEALNEPLTNTLAKTLFAVEELTGLITACALVQPDKKLSSVSVESIKKKFKQKAFAAGVNREIIKKSEELLNMKLDDVFALTLKAMQDNSNELGL